MAQTDALSDWCELMEITGKQGAPSVRASPRKLRVSASAVCATRE
jgi:hypothetical protein